MPLLTPQTKVQLEDFKCKLPSELMADVQAYALAINSDKDYVIQKAIERLMADKEFRQWKQKNANKIQQAQAENSKLKRGPKPKTEATPISGKVVA